MTTKMANFVKYATHNQIFFRNVHVAKKYKHYITIVLQVNEYMANSKSWLSKKDDPVMRVNSKIVNSLAVYLYLDHKDILCTLL